MKKLLLLLFAILFLVSHSVSATTSFHLTDSEGHEDISLISPVTVELLLWYTGDPIISFDVEVDVTGQGTILGGEITATGRNSECDNIWMPGTIYGYDIELIGSTDNGQLEPGFANPLATMTYLPDEVGDVVLNLYNIGVCCVGGDWIDPVFHDMTIHQEPIPEPATMILLCLGGLLIKTKK